MQGDNSGPFLGQTVGAALKSAARRWPAHLALVCAQQKLRFTWAELNEIVNSIAAGLQILGLAPGDRIGLWSMNRAEWVITQFAAARAGLVLVTINPAYRLAELNHALSVTNCAGLVIGPAFKGTDYPAMVAEIAPGVMRKDRSLSDELTDLKVVIQIGEHTLPRATSWTDLERLGGAADIDHLNLVADQVQIDDPVNIQFTSGTTGTPKGVVLSHHNILNNGYFTGRALKMSPGEKLCLPVPLYHCFGMVTGSLLCLTHGVCIVLPGEGFDPLATLNAIQTERCNSLYGVPTMYISMFEVENFSDFDLSSLRTGIMAGALCPEELMRSAIEKMHMRDIAICYGMTECPVTFQTSTDDTLERRTTSVGKVQPHFEAKIIDEEGRVVPRGVVGEICTRGYSSMLEYWHDDAATRKMKDAAGWIHTGDLGLIDDDGYCRMAGRKTDMVIRGGENLYPKEIEEFLFAHPDIVDVHVFGVADKKYGEELCAWIIKKNASELTENDIWQYCRGAISHQKIPKYIRFVQSFPMTVTGKVQKAHLKNEMERILSDL